MFSDRKEKRANIEPTTGQNRINEGTKLKGDISSSGFFRIDGTIEGNVQTPSKVVLGKSGVIIGTLVCENADIEGTFQGNLNVTGVLSIRATGRIEGDVIAGKLSVEPGAVLNASCTMQDGKTTASAPTPLPKTKEPKAHPFDRMQRAKKSPVEQPTSE